MAMRILRYLVFGVGIGLNGVQVASGVRPGPGLQAAALLLGVALFALLVVSLIAGRLANRNPGTASRAPVNAAVLLLLAVIPTTLLGGRLRELRFRAEKPRFERVVALLADGRLPAPEQLARVSLPAEYNDLSAVVLAEKAGGVLTVEFLTGGGFPSKHSGYLYRSSGPLEAWPLANRWARRARLDEHWYRISD